jgi:hypothetical protein
VYYIALLSLYCCARHYVAHIDCCEGCDCITLRNIPNTMTCNLAWGECKDLHEERCGDAPHRAQLFMQVTLCLLCLTGLEEENSDLSEVEVDEVLGLMSDVTAKVAT